MIIYKITNLINNKIYIGKYEGNCFESYWGSGTLLKKAINKYGIENFIKEIVEICIDRNHCCEREIYWIKFYNSTDINTGYNICKGGEGFTGKHAIETKQKISESQKGNQPWNKGIPQSKDSNIRRSITLKGRPKPNGFLKGRIFSEEHRKKLSLSSKGKPKSELHILHMKGKKLSEETKIKISKSLKGRKVWNKGLTTNNKVGD